MSKTSFKGFIVPGSMYKLKTMVKNQHKPVVYHAEALDADKSTQLLLEGQESLAILPFDCDEKFMNVTVTTAPQQDNGKWHNSTTSRSIIPVDLKSPIATIAYQEKGAGRGLLSPGAPNVLSHSLEPKAFFLLRD